MVKALKKRIIPKFEDKIRLSNIEHFADSVHYDKTFCGLKELRNENNLFVYYDDIKEIEGAYTIPDNIIVCKHCNTIAAMKLLKGEDRLRRHTEIEDGD